ncbi:MAG: hypothetical protein V7K42_02530 [Nostoc sp.]
MNKTQYTFIPSSQSPVPSPQSPIPSPLPLRVIQKSNRIAIYTSTASVHEMSKCYLSLSFPETSANGCVLLDY